MMATSFQQRASWGIFSLLALMPLLAVYAPIGMTPLAIAVALLAAAWVKQPPLFPLSATFWAMAGALLAWGGMTSWWAIHTGSAATHLAKLSGMLAVAWVVHRVFATSRAPWKLLLGGFVLGLAAVWLAQATQGASLGKARPYWEDHKLNRGVCILAVMLWPLLGLMWNRMASHTHRALACAALVLATAATVLPMASQSASLGLVLGIGTAGVAAWKRGFARILAWVVPVCVLVMLAGFTQLPAQRLAEQNSQLPQSALHRLYIWQFAAERAMERPLAGWGLGSSRHLPGGRAVVYPDKILMPLHPHNSALQLWVELGLPGVFAFLAATFFLFQRIAALPVPWAACGTGLLVSYLAIGLTAYGVWQEWWIATGILSSAAMAMFLREQRDDTYK